MHSSGVHLFNLFGIFVCAVVFPLVRGENSIKVTLVQIFGLLTPPLAIFDIYVFIVSLIERGIIMDNCTMVSPRKGRVILL